MTASHALRNNVPKVRALIVSRLGASRYTRRRGDQDRYRHQAEGMVEALRLLLSGGADGCVSRGLGAEGSTVRLRAHLSLAEGFLGEDWERLGFTGIGQTSGRSRSATKVSSARRPRTEHEKQLRDAAYRVYEEQRAKGKQPDEAWDRITDLVDLNICAVALADERRLASDRTPTLLLDEVQRLGAGAS